MELTPNEAKPMSVLLCVDETRAQTQLLEQLSNEFDVYTGLFAEDVTLKLRTNEFEVIIIATNFGGSEFSFNPILEEATHLPIAQRRRQFIALIGPELSTNNEMQAFQHSVDLVFAVSDIENFKLVLRRSLERHREFYRPFVECLRLAGAQ